MKLATIHHKGTEIAGVVTRKGVVPIDRINKERGWDYSENLYTIIGTGQLSPLRDWYREEGETWLNARPELSVPHDRVTYAPLYRQPNKIFGIGLNYVEHAGDLAEKAPTQFPASFFKPNTAVIGYGDSIKIPALSQKTTGEAELGVIIGRECEDIDPGNWLEYVAGFTTIIDMTAEDILRHNPRYLTMAKSFGSFLSFGPHLVTPDEIEDVAALRVSTVLNGEVYAENVVANMTFPPAELVAFHSRVMRWLPGDILSTGTPRAVHIRHGDVVECRIDGFESLVNPVIDTKAS